MAAAIRLGCLSLGAANDDEDATSREDCTRSDATTAARRG
jgi:hypothetical protein